MSDHSDEDLWNRYVKAHKEVREAFREFNTKAVDKIACIKRSLDRIEERMPALIMTEYLTAEELKEIFAELLSLASIGHGSIHVVRERILSLPKDWLLANIEEYAEPILKVGDSEEYRRLLELYFEIDRDLTERLIKRAISQSDPDIVEAGQDFIERLLNDNS